MLNPSTKTKQNTKHSMHELCKHNAYSKQCATWTFIIGTVEESNSYYSIKSQTMWHNYSDRRVRYRWSMCLIRIRINHNSNSGLHGGSTTSSITRNSLQLVSAVYSRVSVIRQPPFGPICCRISNCRITKSDPTWGLVFTCTCGYRVYYIHYRLLYRRVS